MISRKPLANLIKNLLSAKEHTLQCSCWPKCTRKGLIRNTTASFNPTLISSKETRMISLLSWQMRNSRFWRQAMFSLQTQCTLKRHIKLYARDYLRCPCSAIQISRSVCTLWQAEMLLLIFWGWRVECWYHLLTCSIERMRKLQSSLIFKTISLLLQPIEPSARINQCAMYLVSKTQLKWTFLKKSRWNASHLNKIKSKREDKKQIYTIRISTMAWKPNLWAAK